MRLKNLVLTAAGGGLLTVGFVAVPSEAALTIFCDGYASDVTIPGDLVVRADASCELSNVTITGNATVRANANLLLESSVIGGQLRVNDNGFASLVDTELIGATRLNQAFGVYSEDSSHELNVVATDSEFFYSLGSSFGRNVKATDVETFLESSRVGRDIVSDGGLLTDVYDSVVEGDMSVSDTELGSVVCFSEIDGDAAFTGNGGIVQLGGSAPVRDCGFNVFGGGVTLTGNVADSSVTGNVVRGDLVCADNSPAPVVSDNRVRGAEDCGSAAAAAKLGTRGGGAVAARKAEVLDSITERTKASEAEAEGAGPAFE